MLSAEDSTIVAKKDQYGRSALPQRTEASRLAVDIRERDWCQLAAERFRHAGHSLAGER
jgi:hypothetical protein